MDQTTTLNIYTDGGSRGNPGQAALGVHVENGTGVVLAKLGKTLGVATNNVAEYAAIIEGLNWVVSHKSEMPKLSRLNFFMDSQLASSQLNGLYKVKNANLRNMLFVIRQKESMLSLPVSYSHVPREQNTKADKLVNLALDGILI